MAFYSKLLKWGILIIFIISIVLIVALTIMNSGNKGSYDSKQDIIDKVNDIFNIENRLKTSPTWSPKTPSTGPREDYTIRDRNNLRCKKYSKGETITRESLRRIFNRPNSFNSIRPDFLKNPVTGNKNNLEIDCYDENLKLGVEYNGRQHYEYTPYFHKNKQEFLNQKYRDELKRRMCKDNGVNLIEIPYTVKPNKIQGYIMKEIESLGYLR
ncbi:MAG: hypothetical protein JKX76_00685 [Colwellia sp.]|nr:hypothetical protein [Colwellia sp.]